ncbi:MKCA [Enterospora canceri]|uniref:MKCA n=1 Tax=Enterospora canceri TaxID=1081671 RepID=A0A1Y1S647_9MICR|nr:MKCA [Enterospora canceri]
MIVYLFDKLNIAMYFFDQLLIVSAAINNDSLSAEISNPEHARYHNNCLTPVEGRKKRKACCGGSDAILSQPECCLVLQSDTENENSGHLLLEGETISKRLCKKSKYDFTVEKKCAIMKSESNINYLDGLTRPIIKRTKTTTTYTEYTEQILELDFKNPKVFRELVKTLIKYMKKKDDTAMKKYLMRHGFILVTKHKKTAIYVSSCFCLKINIAPRSTELEPLMLSMVKSDHVLRQYCFEICDVKRPQTTYNQRKYEDNHTVCFMLLEKLEFISSRNMIKSENDVRIFARDLLQGVADLHMYHLVHTDIKMNNVMGRNENGRIVWKLIDLDVACKTHFGMYKCLGSWCLNHWFFPPEYALKRIFTEQGDVWSVGILLYQLLFFNRKEAMVRNSLKRQLKSHFGYRYLNIRKVDLTSRILIEYPDDISESCKDFINKMLIVDYDKRPSAYEMLSHRFLKN